MLGLTVSDTEYLLATGAVFMPPIDPGFVPKYCHTHGSCTHIGTECNNRGKNHQENATITNRMGGSTRNVPTRFL